MPIFLGIGALLVSALWGGASILDSIEDMRDENSFQLINLGSVVLVVIGGVVVWYLMKKK